MQIHIQFTPDELMRASKSGVLENLFDVTKSPAERGHENRATENKATNKQPDEKATAEVTPPEDSDTEEITLEDVRAAFMAKNSKANTAKLKAILEKHKVKKVTELEPKDFASVLKALEAI